MSLVGSNGWRRRVLLAPAGAVLLFLGRRALEATAAAPWLTGAGVLLFILALAWALLAATQAEHGSAQRRIWSRLAWPEALFLLAAGLQLGAGALADAPLGAIDWAAVARGGWLLSAVLGVPLYLFLHLAVLVQARTPQPDADRVDAAAAAALTVGLLLALLASLNVIFNTLPWQWDLAYFKTTNPSELTIDQVRTLEEPVDVALFFPPDSVPGSLVQDYFNTLSSAEGTARLRVHFLDTDLHPEQAEDYEARQNGSVILRKGEVRSTINVGEELEKARPQLRKFDENFYRKLLEISRQKQVAYFTVGHGERNESGNGAADRDGRVTRLQNLMRARNFEVKSLGLSEGLGEAVPADATLVVVAGALEPLLPAEAETLRRYVADGGRLAVFMEPQAQRQAPPPVASGKGSDTVASLAELLQYFGIGYTPVMLANDRYFGRRTYTQADHSLLVTVGYQAHPAVEQLRRGANQFPLLMLGAGALELKGAPKGSGRPGEAPLESKGVIKAMEGTWYDFNRNFTYDGALEKRGEPWLAVAVTPQAPPEEEDANSKRQRRRPPRPQGIPEDGPRLLAFGDVDVVSDLLMQVRGNQMLAEESLAWLAGRQAPVSLPTSEEDVRIRHAREDDWIWFYLPVIGVPALVLGFGLWRVRRLRRGQGGLHE